jgi:hypothetical protein
MSGDASAGARGEGRCGAPTSSGDDCELPASRSDGRCHIHTDASEAAETGETTADYDEMLATLDVAIDEAKRKIENGRVRDPDKEKIRVKQWRSLGYLINVRRQVTNDRDLEELAEQVEQLKETYKS